MKRTLVPLLLVGVALGLTACGGSRPRIVRGAPPPPSAAELRKLAHLALRVSRGAGDAHPTDAIVVRTTRRIAEAVDAGSGRGYASTPAYFVVVHGQFKDCDVSSPPGASCPTGTIVTLTIDPRTNTSTDFGVESRMPDVNKIGTSEPLPLSAPLVTHTTARALRHAQAAEIRVARESDADLFRAFPAWPGVKPCAIPNGGMAPAPLKGTCRTSVAYPVTHGHYLEAFVRFHETWGLGHSSSWTLIVQWPAEKVVSTRLHGETSPQMRYAMSDQAPGDQPALDAAASYAEKIAGGAHVFTGVAVDDANDEVDVYLAHAPQSVVDELRKGHPDTYVIHNRAPRTLDTLLQLQRSLDSSVWIARGIKIVMSEPTLDGILVVGVSTNVAKAQAYFDAGYGPSVIRVVHAEPNNLGCACGPTGPKR